MVYILPMLNKYQGSYEFFKIKKLNSIWALCFKEKQKNYCDPNRGIL